MQFSLFANRESCQKSVDAVIRSLEFAVARVVYGFAVSISIASVISVFFLKKYH